MGPEPDGSIPAAALERLKGIGRWLEQNGESVYGTTAGDVPERPWGVTTQKGNKQYVHILSLSDASLFLPISRKIARATVFGTDKKVDFRQSKEGVLLNLGEVPDSVDYIVELTMK